MRKFILAFAALVTLTVFAACTKVTPGAGEEAVLVYQPWFFGHGGVDETPVQTGLTWCAPTTGYIIFKIIPVQYNESFKDIISLDNTPISLTAHALIQIIPGKTPYLYEHFGEEWYQNIIQKDFCNEVRNEISKYPMIQLTSKRSIYDNISKHIEQILNKKIAQEKIPIRLQKVIIDKAKPNQEVMEEYNHTASAIQKLQTEEANARMQEVRKISEAKRAEADDAYRVRMGLNPDQFIRLRSLEIERDKVDMVRDKKNVNITMLMGNGAQPYFKVNP